MKKAFVFIALALLLNSCKKEEDKEPSYITIKSIEVVDFPPVNAAGDNWDTSAGPDIYPVVTYNGTELYRWETTPWEDAVSGNTHIFYVPGNFNLKLENLSETYTVNLFDNDDFFGDEEMNGIYFKPNDKIEGLPEEITLKNTSLRTEFILTLEYHF